MTTECTSVKMNFQASNARKVEASFTGGYLSSEGGALLLREVEQRDGIIKRFSQCFVDERNPDSTEHTLEQLLTQRIMGLALGYQDLNDHDALCRDPLLALAAGKADIEGNDRRRASDRGTPLASRNTLNRLELSDKSCKSGKRYKKIRCDTRKVEALLIALFLESFSEAPEEIVLDFDATDIPLHGEQESRFYHGYYKNYCYLPLYVTCGDFVLGAKLRPANIDASKGTLPLLKPIVTAIRAQYPDTRIILRGDAGFARERIMHWCEKHNVYYVLGLGKNKRLNRCIVHTMDRAKIRMLTCGVAQRQFTSFLYSTLETWSRERRVVAKAEVLPKGENPRYVVTNLEESYATPRELYEELYCARGDMENRIKEQQLELFADRTSAHLMEANQLRLFFSLFAYILIRQVRGCLAGTRMDKATSGTIRKKLLKIAARVTISVRRIMVYLPTACPDQNLFIRAWRKLRLPLHPI